MNFTAYLLARHPEVQDKLRAEIEAALPDGASAEYDLVAGLPYLDQVQEIEKLSFVHHTYWRRIFTDNCPGVV